MNSKSPFCINFICDNIKPMLTAFIKTMLSTEPDNTLL